MNIRSASLQLLILSLFGWPLIWVGVIIMGALWADYGFMAHTVSVLGSPIAPLRHVMMAIFVINGILLILSGYKLNQILEKSLFGLSMGHFLSLSGFLLAIMAFVPGGDSIGLELNTQIAHEIIATTLIVSFILASLLFIWQVYEVSEWNDIIIPIMILTIFKIIFYILSVVVKLFSGAISELPGLFQKLGLFMEGIWIISVSSKLYMIQHA